MNIDDYLEDVDEALMGNSSTGAFGILDIYIDATKFNTAALAGVIAMIVITSKIIKSWLGEERLDVTSLVRPLVIILCILFYQNMVDIALRFPVGIVQAIVDAGRQDTESTFNNVMNHRDGGATSLLVVATWFFEILSMLLSFIAYCIACYIQFKQVIQSTIYYCLGPLALAFSLIPSNEAVLNKWYQGYLGVLLWTPITGIIRTIICAVGAVQTNLGGADLLFTFAIQIVLVFAILKVSEYSAILVAQPGPSKATEEFGLGRDFRQNLYSAYNKRSEKRKERKKEKIKEREKERKERRDEEKDKRRRMASDERDLNERDRSANNSSRSRRESSDDRSNRDSDDNSDGGDYYSNPRRERDRRAAESNGEERERERERERDFDDFDDFDGYDSYDSDGRSDRDDRDDRDDVER